MKKKGKFGSIKGRGVAFTQVQKGGKIDKGRKRKGCVESSTKVLLRCWGTKMWRKGEEFWREKREEGLGGKKPWWGWRGRFRSGMKKELNGSACKYTTHPSRKGEKKNFIWA